MTHLLLSVFAFSLSLIGMVLLNIVKAHKGISWGYYLIVSIVTLNAILAVQQVTAYWHILIGQ